MILTGLKKVGDRAHKSSPTHWTDNIDDRFKDHFELATTVPGGEVRGIFMRQIGRKRSSASDTLSSAGRREELLLIFQRSELQGPGTSEIINASSRYVNS